ncbi:Retrotransposon protein [Seminavis robusta]|uniref:Retrotransposon protein n=1 Tax=Seminavis robusta TaxID=568900 RepID=A0A9N8DGP6_9STRA|nr:Retrotransposon protein [Seminavis robusta]|eukprot:Sro117_g057340.1 Retrotransposon protein (227) ;mRNA; r:35027-35707
MASIIKLLRSPKDEFPKAKVSFSILLDPDNNVHDVATMEVPVYEMGDVEDWLEWRKLFDRLLTAKNLEKGPSLFRHARILLAGGALSKFNDIATKHIADNNDEETKEAFDVTLKEFTNSMLPSHTAKRVKRYLLEIQKPIYMSVSQFVVRLQQMNSYFPYMPDVGGQNVMLTPTDMKFVLEQAVPQAWRSALERSGQHEAMNFSEVEDYFKTLEHLEEETVRGSKS